MLLHQRGLVLPPGFGSLGSGDPSKRCGVISAAITPWAYGDTRSPQSASIRGAVLPVDFAVAWDGAYGYRTVIAGAGAIGGHGVGFTTLDYDPRTDLFQGYDQDCWGDTGHFPSVSGPEDTPIAVARWGSRLLVQVRDPAALVILDGENGGARQRLELSSEPVGDTGHVLFHMDTGAGVACASCHAEGHEDGRVWMVGDVGQRRTQSLRTGLRGTEPFTWDGSAACFADVLHETLIERMSGEEPSAAQATALFDWLETLRPPPRSPADAAAVARGHTVFTDPAVGCATCHAGPQLTDNRTVDVGTGGAFQVPTLRDVVNRAPLFHDGCAPTLVDVLLGRACGDADRHGRTSGLSTAQLEDLRIYLESL